MAFVVLALKDTSPISSVINQKQGDILCHSRFYNIVGNKSLVIMGKFTIRSCLSFPEFWEIKFVLFFKVLDLFFYLLLHRMLPIEVSFLRVKVKIFICCD